LGITSEAGKNHLEAKGNILQIVDERGFFGPRLKDSPLNILKQGLVAVVTDHFNLYGYAVVTLPRRNSEL
jgi:hypothetical protein